MSSSEPLPDPLPGTRIDPREKWLQSDLEKTSIVGNISDRFFWLCRLKLRYYVAAGAIVAGGLGVKSMIDENPASKTTDTIITPIVDTEAPSLTACAQTMQHEIEGGIPVSEAWSAYNLCEQNQANGADLLSPPQS